MKEVTGLYPRVRVDAAGSGVASQAGGMLLVEAVRVSGIDRALSTCSTCARGPKGSGSSSARSAHIRTRNCASPTSTGTRITAFATNTPAQDRHRTVRPGTTAPRRARCEDRVRCARDTGLSNRRSTGPNRDEVDVNLGEDPDSAGTKASTAVPGPSRRRRGGHSVGVDELHGAQGRGRQGSPQRPDRPARQRCRGQHERVVEYGDGPNAADVETLVERYRSCVKAASSAPSTTPVARSCPPPARRL